MTATLDAPCAAEALYSWIDDLGRYPEWLDLVPRAVAAAPDQGDEGPAWLVDLRGRIGPLARSKRLRMVRTRHERPVVASFARRELDGRRHSPWVLTATVEPVAAGACLSMHMHYGGGLWGPVLEPMLRDAIERSRPRLLELVAG